MRKISIRDYTEETTICIECKHCHKLYFWCYNRFCQHPRHKEIDLFFGTTGEGFVDCNFKNNGKCDDFEKRNKIS